ncbi:MAG: SDR family oxidoreductase, partial [Tomitella sp.]|nr:SDR family oxidoreductase [Tomitella sp.]
SAIDLSATPDLSMKKYDLMQDINCRGAFLLAKTALPHLRKSSAAHILSLSPPINLNPRWAGESLGYTIAKYGMSLVTLGLAEELRDDGIAANSLWPRTTIGTAAVANILGGDELMARSRSPRIVADSAWAILTRDPRTCTGNFFIDDEVLAEEGQDDLSGYGGTDLNLDLFLDE